MVVFTNLFFANSFCTGLNIIFKSKNHNVRDFFLKPFVKKTILLLFVAYHTELNKLPACC